MIIQRIGSIITGKFSTKAKEKTKCKDDKDKDDYSTPSTIDGYINNLGYIHLNLSGVPEEICSYVGKLCFKMIVLSGKNPSEELVNCYLKKVN